MLRALTLSLTMFPSLYPRTVMSSRGRHQAHLPARGRSALLGQIDGPICAVMERYRVLRPRCSALACWSAGTSLPGEPPPPKLRA